MAESHDKPGSSIRTLWPLFVGGLLGPFVGQYLENWLAPHTAVALAFFLAWLVAGVLMLRRPPGQKWTFQRWTLGGAVGAVVAGAVTFLFK